MELIEGPAPAVFMLGMGDDVVVVLLEPEVEWEGDIAGNARGGSGARVAGSLDLCLCAGLKGSRRSDADDITMKSTSRGYCASIVFHISLTRQKIYIQGEELSFRSSTELKFTHQA